MKLYIALIISVLASGCTSRVIVTTHHPQDQEYDLSFGWRLVKEAKDKSLTQNDREEKYEAILNKVLKNDPNTSRCEIIKESFHYFEPGCCAAARVICKTPIEFETSEGSYNNEGIPLYIYRVKQE